MRFIVDESTGAAVVEQLRRLGHDVVAVAEEMPQAADADILKRAAREDRIVLTAVRAAAFVCSLPPNSILGQTALY